MSSYLILLLAFFLSVGATGIAATVAGTTSHHTIATKIIFSRAVNQLPVVPLWLGLGRSGSNVPHQQFRSNHPSSCSAWACYPACPAR